MIANPNAVMARPVACQADQLRVVGRGVGELLRSSLHHECGNHGKHHIDSADPPRQCLNQGTSAQGDQRNRFKMV